MFIPPVFFFINALRFTPRAPPGPPHVRGFVGYEHNSKSFLLKKRHSRAELHYASGIARAPGAPLNERVPPTGAAAGLEMFKPDGVMWRRVTPRDATGREAKKRRKRRKKEGMWRVGTKTSAVGAPVTPECRGLNGHSDRKG